MNTLKMPQQPLDYGLDHGLPAHQRRYLVEHVTCPMCETILKITHEINKNNQKVKEEAHCPECGIRARAVTHDMH